MVYKLKPLELDLDFEDRGYDLGDSIDIQVTMTPNGDVDVRGGRLDLVCEQHYSQRGTTFVPERLHKAAMPGGVMTGSKREVRTDRKEKVMHSTVSLQEPGRFRNGTPSTRTARLLVQPTPPPHFEEAMALQGDAQSSWTFKWRLVATINVARGRDPKVQRTVKIRLAQAAAGGRVGAKPRMSTPKRRTGSAAGE